MATEKNNNMGEKRHPSEDGSNPEFDHHEDRTLRGSDDVAPPNRKSRPDTQASKPLAGYSRDQLAYMGETYAREKQGMTDEDDIRAFRLGAIIASEMDADDEPSSLRDKYARIEGLTEEERQSLLDEVEHKWRHPKMLYYLVTGTSTLFSNELNIPDRII